MTTLSVAILTVSDSCGIGTATDTSGHILQELVKHSFNTSCIKYKVVTDDIKKIEGALIFFCDFLNINVVFTTGGTGFSPRDVTPEATKNVIEKETPQLTLAMALCSFNKTKFAALSRAVSGIRKQTLIINFPGSKKAVEECFSSICDIIPHAIELIRNHLPAVKQVHNKVQNTQDRPVLAQHRHICPHKTGDGSKDDRNSPFPMIEVDAALAKMFKSIIKKHVLDVQKSHVNLPPFRASIKDGYAIKSSGGMGLKNVIGSVTAGDGIIAADFHDNECFKINTGAPVPHNADCIIQIEDTKLISSENGVEKTINILVEPTVNLDIRPIGCDLRKDEHLFTDLYNPGAVVWKSMMASIGRTTEIALPEIGIISTGDELVQPGIELQPGKIYDSNTTMLTELLRQFGFTKIKLTIVKDNYESLRNAMELLINECPITICTGGVSMGDKDFVKSVITDLGLTIHFGRVNMKPGKPMTYATNGKGSSVFGLPGNPVSAFVTFHLFVLPALRMLSNYDPQKLSLPVINIELRNDSLELDPRPEYVRATVISKNGKLYAEVTGNQISSRLQSIDGADVLLHLPSKTAIQTCITKGTLLKASVLRHDFISKYE